jgi:type I restriction enzyme R subunit
VFHDIDIEEIEEEFDKFVEVERDRAFQGLVEKEKLHDEELQNVVKNYLYDGRKPLNDDIVKTLQVKPKLLQRKKVVLRVLNEIIGYIEKFYDG